VRAADYDGDGVVELFVGQRLKPFLYGVPVSSYLLENDGLGNFTPVNDRVAPGLNNVGMIRDMSWTDVDGDADLDMILVGDWMPLRVFLNKEGIFEEKKDAFGTESTEGWWNCIATGDFDGDGDMDFLAGNHGTNSRFHASPDKPVRMYVNDFDMNGTVEQVICLYEGDFSYPLALKHDLVGQLPGLADKYPRYELYKGQQITDILTPPQLEKAIILEAKQLKSSLFVNDGTGFFTRRDLPGEVQFSPVFAMKTGDFNGDGIMDVLTGGNLYNVKPEVGRYDASYGSCLLGDGNGGFRSVPKKTSGFHLKGEVREIINLNADWGELFVVARNNEELQIFSIHGK
jgi:hypothetical protein